VTDEQRPDAPAPQEPPNPPLPPNAPNPGTPAALSEPRPRRRWWRYVALAVPLVVVSVAGLLLGVYVYLLSQIAVGPPGEAAQRPQARLFAWPLRLVDRVNILIIGVDVTLDNRRQVVNVSRADTLVLLTIDPERRRLAAVSLPRDTRASIPGFGTTKINASYAYGGPQLTIRTVEQLLAVKVHYYVKLGPDSFKTLIDAVGGLEIDVEKDMKYTDTWAGYVIDLKKGRRKLSGDQVTGYIRFRHDALGDIGRVERQRKVMSILVRELKQPSVILHAPSLMRAFAENTETDLSAVELMSLGLFAIRSKELPMEEHTLPGSFAPQYWDPDFAKIRPLVADLYYGVSADELAGTLIEVRNGSGVPGLAWVTAARLAEVGLRNVRVTTAPANVEVTTVISRMQTPSAARLVAAAIGRAVLKHQPGAPGPAITVIVARDGNGRAQGTAPRRSGSQ
jgi:polyisoprenyl-teichoic acid--peptidoglycan teichoic acid transferase